MPFDIERDKEPKLAQTGAEGRHAQTLARDYEALQDKYLAERDKRLRSDGTAQYVAVDNPFIGDIDDPYATAPIERAALTEDVDVVVGGGGSSGLLAAASLLKQDVTNIRMVEKGSDVGGTWYWNRYPGCRCDVDSYTYLLALSSETSRVADSRVSATH